MSMTQYGAFDDAHREYVITEHFPPAAWMNLLLNDTFTAVISQSGGGCCFYDAAATGRLTTYRQEHTVPTDRPGFYLYVREADGTLWSPTFEPVRTELDGWRCRHGMGYTTFEGSYRGLSCTATYFVPRDENILVWDITFRNDRGETVEFDTTSFVEFSFLHALRELELWHWCRFYTAFWYDPARRAIKYEYRVFEDLPKLQVFTTCTEQPVGHDCDRGAFIGRGGTLDQPAAVVSGKLTGSELAGGGHGIGALQCKHTLEAGQEKRFAVTVGCAPTWGQADELIEKYHSLEAVDAARAGVDAFWSERLDVFQCDLPDADIQSLLNVWNPYNCIINVNRKKSMSAAATGMELSGIQTRDTMQDAMSLVSIRTPQARQLLDYVISFQYPSGEYPATIDPSVDAPTEYYAVRSDNGVWPIYTAHAYLAETDDFAWLDSEIRFWVDEGEPETATVLEHLWRGLKHIHNNRGRTGLPLIIDIDWNDNLYIFKETGQEESVMLGQQFVYACRLLKEIAQAADGADELIAWCDAKAADMCNALNSDAVWDGQWYRRYLYGNDDKPHLGSAERQEASLYLNTQTWAVIAQTGQDGREVGALDVALERLATPYGLRLLTPAFTGIPEPQDPMYNNGPGVRENGGVFHHAHAWAVLAAAQLHRGKQAHDLYRQILPNVAAAQRGPDTYINEPYAFSSTTLAPPHPRAGEGDLAWFSGTVTWMYWIGTQHLLGIRPTIDGLLIDPCIPGEWPEFRVTRRFRDCNLKIHVLNPDGVQAGVKAITVNGQPVEGNVLREFPAGETLDVEVTMG